MRTALPFDYHPQTLVHDQSRVLAGLQFGAFTALALAVVAPQIVLAVEALTRADIRAVLAEKPLIALELALAMLFWVLLFAWPLKKLAAVIWRRRHTQIRDETVFVSERRRGSIEAWSMPVGAYSGVRHEIKSSLSGTRHELWLEHSDRRWRVLIMSGEHISAAQIDRVAQALELPRLSTPARDDWNAVPIGAVAA